MDKLKDLCRLCENETESTYTINQKALFNKDTYAKVISEILKIEVSSDRQYLGCVFLVIVVQNGTSI